MDPEYQHDMVLVAEHEDGTQEWVCSTCGRRVMLKWPADDGDSIEVSSLGGSAGGETSEPGDDDDAYLSPFQDWINRRDE